MLREFQCPDFSRDMRIYSSVCTCVVLKACCCRGRFVVMQWNIINLPQSIHFSILYLSLSCLLCHNLTLLFVSLLLFCPPASSSTLLFTFPTPYLDDSRSSVCVCSCVCVKLVLRTAGYSERNHFSLAGILLHIKRITTRDYLEKE